MKELWLAFWRSFSNPFGIAPVRRRVPTLAEDFHAVADDIRDAVELARRHDL